MTRMNLDDKKDPEDPPWAMAGRDHQREGIPLP